jgi:tetratricopeptide (TPR) repeat protein
MPEPGAIDLKTLRATLNQGFEWLARGEIQKAADCCQKALQLKPDLVEAHFLVGLVALEGQDRRTAVQAFHSVTALEPQHAAAWAHLARLYMGDGQVNRADLAVQRATACGSDDPLVHDLLGSVAAQMGDHDIARQHFELAVAKRPEHVPFLLNLANSLVYHGEIEAAAAIYRKTISAQKNTPQAHWALSASKKATDYQHIEEVRALLKEPRIDARGRAFYYYGIGKELEDLGEWDAAFDAFRLGASNRRQTVEYDEAAEIEMFEFLRETFTADWLCDESVGNASASPIFVLGQPRTGTTLVERIISSHSAVHSAGELQQFGLALRRLSKYQDPKRFSSGLFAAALKLKPEAIGNLYLDTTRKMQGTTAHFVDKLPQNYLFLPLILKALPNAKIVHLTRDPRDAVFASFKQLFADAYLHSYELGEAARHHARYWHLMNTWRERFGERFIDVSYEETARNPSLNARRLIEFLDLPWQDACLDFHLQPGAVSTASAVQVREPAHTRSIGRWKQYQRQLEPMLEALIAAGVDFDRN